MTCGEVMWLVLGEPLQQNKSKYFFNLLYMPEKHTSATMTMEQFKKVTTNVHQQISSETLTLSSLCCSGTKPCQQENHWKKSFQNLLTSIAH